MKFYYKMSMEGKKGQLSESTTSGLKIAIYSVIILFLIIVLILIVQGMIGSGFK